jgi:putative transposase
MNKLQMLAERYFARRFDLYYGKIRLVGLVWNRKRVPMVYCLMKLVFKHKLSQQIKQPLEVQKQINYSYSMNFISGALTNGRGVRILNIMDDCNRKCLAAYADYEMESIVV